MGILPSRKRVHDTLHGVAHWAHKNSWWAKPVVHGAYEHVYKKQKIGHERSMVDHNNLTSQHDVGIIYKKPKRSRRKKRFQSFASKVQRALSSKSSKKQYSIMRTWSSSTTAGQQNYDGISMYGNAASDGDITTIFSIVANLPYTNVAIRGIRIRALSCYTSFHATNVGTDPLIMKVYTISFKKDVPVAHGNNVGNLWFNMADESNTFPGSAVGQDGMTAQTVFPPLRPESTPFDCSALCRYITVNKVVEYILQPKEVAAWNVKDKRQHLLTSSDYENWNASAVNAQSIAYRRGVATSQLIVFHGLPITTGATTLANMYPKADLSVVANKSYHFSVTEYSPLDQQLVAGDIS